MNLFRTIRLLPLKKVTKFHVPKLNMSIQAQEINVPTSYGHIAGKTWGPERGRKILALHGWQDNCGTFDTLIPLLPKHLQIAAIDFPGHGFSTHKPLGCSYSFIELLADIKIVASHLKWEKFSLMGHSMGGAAALFYASCFPDEIEAVATMDAPDTDSFSSFNYPIKTAQLVDKIIALNNKLNNSAPVYSYQAAHSRLLEGQKNFMSSEGVTHLLKRALKPSGGDKNSFVFTRDIRLQAFNFHPVSAEIWMAYLQNLQCNLLFIRAKDGVKVRRNEISGFLEKHFKEKNTTKLFQPVVVEGLHHVHLEHPERVAPHISQFFS